MRAALLTRLVLSVILPAFLWLPARPQTVQAADETTTLVIAGTGDSQDILRLLAQRFMQDNPNILVDVPESVGSTAGIRALLAGKAQFARTARPLRDDERDAGLAEFVFAKAPVVFAVHPSVTGVAGLTSAQAQAIFAGRIKSWSALGGPDLPIARVCRETPETSRMILNAAIPDFESEGCRGQAVAYTTPEAVAMVADHPGTIGYFSLAAMTKTSLVPLAFDGASPVPGQRAGRGPYPLIIPFALVSKPPLSPAAERFLKFLAASNAQSLMASRGCLPTAQHPAP